MSDTSILLFLSIVPIILILVFVYNEDKTKEPILLLLKLFVLGIISCFLVLGISKLLGLFLPVMNLSVKEMNFINIIFYSFIGVALIEEFCKWVMVYFFGYRSREFDELYDVIVYSVFVALGFAFFENIVYVFLNHNLKTAILRAVSAIPGHACDAVYMGYYLSLAKQFHYKGKKELERKNIFLSILIPTILHGVYDFCLMSGYTILVYVFLAFVMVLYIISVDKLKELSKINKKINYKNRFCPKCGSIVEGDFCDKCGTRQE